MHSEPPLLNMMSLHFIHVACIFLHENSSLFIQYPKEGLWIVSSLG